MPARRTPIRRNSKTGLSGRSKEKPKSIDLDASFNRILPPEFGTFFPPARVVTGFLSIYVFHIVAMHMKYHLLQNGAVSNYN